MYFSVKSVQPQDDYFLLITFENGEKRKFDMKPYLNVGIFSELKDEKLFRTVHTSFDTIGWENDLDIDPEILYQKSIKME